MKRLYKENGAVDYDTMFQKDLELRLKEAKRIVKFLSTWKLRLKNNYDCKELLNQLELIDIGVQLFMQD